MTKDPTALLFCCITKVFSGFDHYICYFAQNPTPGQDHVGAYSGGSHPNQC